MAKITLTELRQKHTGLIAKYNEELRENGDFKTLQEIDKEIATCEDDYLGIKQAEIYAEARLSDDPVATIITRDHFQTLTHKVKKGKETGLVIGYEQSDETKGEKKGKRVRLSAFDFCDRSKLPTEFTYRVAELNKLLLLKGMSDIDATAEEILAANDSYYLEKQVDCLMEYKAQITGEDGKVDPTKATKASPVSNKSLIAKLQECFDAIPVHAKMTATKRHLGYLLNTYSTKGKEPEEIRLLTDGKFMELFQNTCHAELTKKAYTFTGYETVAQHEEAEARKKKEAEEKAAEAKIAKDKKPKTKAKAEKKTADAKTEEKAA